MSSHGTHRFAAFVRDITERKRSEQDLQESSEMVRLLLDSTAEAIYGVDMQGNCTLCNRACVKLLGYREAADLLGKNMHEVVHYKRADGTPYPVEECQIYQAFRHGKGSHVDDEVLWRNDGTNFPAEYWSFPIFRREQVIGAVVTFVDITERRRVEVALLAAKEAAEQSNRAKSEFLANMSHEIRTPMNGIIGMTELMLDTELTPEQSEYLQMVKTSADSLLTIINDILDFSKIEAGKLQLDAIPFDLRKSLEEVMKVLAIKAHSKGLALFLTVHPSVPASVVGDPARLRQILINLVGNALKFTARGDIAVAVRKETEREDCTIFQRHGDRNSTREAAVDFRCIFPGGFINHAEVWRNRTRTRHLKSIGSSDGRPNLGRKRSWTWFYVSLYRCAGPRIRDQRR